MTSLQRYPWWDPHRGLLRERARGKTVHIVTVPTNVPIIYSDLYRSSAMAPTSNSSPSPTPPHTTYPVRPIVNNGIPFPGPTKTPDGSTLPSSALPPPRSPISSTHVRRKITARSTMPPKPLAVVRAQTGESSSGSSVARTTISSGG